MKSVIRTMLVIGDEPDVQVAKFAQETKVEPYVKAKLDDVNKLKESHLSMIEKCMESDVLKLTVAQREMYKDMYLEIKEMDDIDYFISITGDCYYDEETGDAVTTENPQAKYMGAKCYDRRIRLTGEEAPCSTPFVLRDGTKAYSARVDEIDWNKIHMNNVGVYESAWEVCVEGRKPSNEMEETIYRNMANRHDYFLNFKDKDEYVRHSCSFWTYAVIRDGKYESVTYKMSDKEWVAKFYGNYILPLIDGGENPLVSLYEIRLLD